MVADEDRGDEGASITFDAASEKETRLVRRGDAVVPSESSAMVAALAGVDGLAIDDADESDDGNSLSSSTIWSCVVCGVMDRRLDMRAFEEGIGPGVPAKDDVEGLDISLRWDAATWSSSVGDSSAVTYAGEP